MTRTDRGSNIRRCMKKKMMIESRKRNSDQVERKLREYEDIICDDTVVRTTSTGGGCSCHGVE